MNKIFKVIWNHATQTWVATSELSKAKGKTKSKTTAVAAAVVAATAALASGSAAAAELVTGTNLYAETKNIAASTGTATQDGATVEVTTPASFKILVGQTATETQMGEGSGIAIGNNATLGIPDALLSGVKKSLTGFNSTVIGNNVAAMSNNSVVLGTDAVSGINPGSTDSADAVKDAEITKWRTNNTVIGQNVSATSGLNVVIGSDSKSAGGEGNVVLGYGAVAKPANNGVNDIEGAVAIGNNATSSARGASAIGQNANATSDFSMAYGAEANATGNNAISIGHNSTASADNTIATGLQANASGWSASAIGNSANASGQRATAVGKSSEASGYSSTALGENATATGESSIAVGNNADANALNSIALGRANNVTSTGTSSTAIGYNNTVTAPNTLVLGNNVTANDPNSVILGNNSSGKTRTTVGKVSVAGSGGNSYTYNYDSTQFAGNKGELGYVSVGAPGAERAIQNVAAGEISATSTDAMNGSQLYAVMQRVENANWTIGQTTSVDPVAKISPSNRVNFDNGTLTVATVTKQDNGANVTYNVQTQKIVTDTSTGEVKLDGNATAGGTDLGKQNGDALVTAKDVLDAINASGWKAVSGGNKGAGDEADAKLITQGDTVTFSAGKNLTVKRTGNTFEYATADDVTFNSTTSTSIKAGSNTANPITIGTTADGKNQITGLNSTLPEATAATTSQTKPGTVDATKAATLGDVLNAGWNLNVAGKAVDFVTPYDTVSFANGTGTTVTYEGNAIKVNLNTGTLTVDETTGKVTAPTTGSDAANQIATTGTVAEAIAKSGWIARAGKAEKDTNGVVEGSSDNLVNPGENVTFNAGKNIKLVQAGNNFTISTVDDIQQTSVTVKGPAGADGTPGKDAVTIKGTDGVGTIGINGKDGANANITVSNTGPATVNGTTINRIQYVTNNPDGTTTTENVATLSDGMKYTGDRGTQANLTLNSLVTVKGGAAADAKVTEGNLAVTSNGKGELLVQLVEKVNLGANGSVTAGNVQINTNGDGKISGVTDGAVTADSTDAINGSQLYATNQNVSNLTNNVTNLTNNVTNLTNTVADVAKEAAKHTTVASTDSSVVITEGTNAAGGKNYNVSLAPVVTIGKDAPVTIDGNKGTITAGNITINDGGKITGVNDGTLAADSKDVVNGSQLYATNQNVTNLTNDVKNITNTLGNGTLSFQGNTGDVITKKLDETLTVKGELANGTASAKNVRVDSEAGALVVKIAENPEFNTVVIGDKSGANGTTTISTVAGKDYNSNGTLASDKAVSALSVGGNQITNVANGNVSVTSTDAINGSQLYAVKELIGKNANSISIAVDGKDGTSGTAAVNGKAVDGTNGDAGEKAETIRFIAGDNMNLTREGGNITFAVSKDPTFNTVHTIEKVTVGGANGTNAAVTISGKNGQNGTIGINGANGTSANITIDKGPAGVNGKDGEQTTRIQYVDEKGNKQNVATLNDGMKYAGDRGTQANLTLNSLVTVKGGAAADAKVTEGNIAVTSNGKGELLVQLAEDINLGANGSVKAGTVSVTNANGPAVNLTTTQGQAYTTAGAADGTNKVSTLSVADSNGNATRITNVANGEISATSTDAINGAQLYSLQTNVGNQFTTVNNQLVNLNNRVTEVEDNAYAGAASALAAAGLPQAYLPGKSLVAVGAGTYKGETGYAVSFSSISDGGNWIFKGTGSTNSQGNVAGTVGVGYQF